MTYRTAVRSTISLPSDWKRQQEQHAVFTMICFLCAFISLSEDKLLHLEENKKETKKWFNALGRSTPFGGTKFGLTRSISAVLRRITSAMTAHPEMVAGTDRICTQLMAAFGDRIFCKSGASAFYAVGIKDKGIGIALKMEDGASSIVPYAILSVLTQLGVITPEEACSLPRYHDKNLYNNHHAVVGRTELAFQLEQLC